ncbi:MAG: glycosyltransferase family 4 protein [Lachnospiraceae bacterium]|nr:glycosyltransferase family 4 protein [Lachnospiraceae bacterium]
MRVLMLCKNAEIGGLTMCTGNLARSLESYCGIRTVIAICEGESVHSTLADLETHIVPFDTKNPLRIIRNYRTVARLVREKEIDVLHAQNRIPALYAALYHFFHRRVPYLWANHQTPIPAGFFHRRMTRYGYKAVAEGENGKKLLIRDLKIPARDVEVINLGVELGAIRKTSDEEQRALKARYGIGEDEKVLLLYGRLDRSKGHLHLLSALEGLTEYPFRVVFPGEDDVYKKEIIEDAKKRNMEDRLIFPGFIRGNSWLSISDLMVLPSRQEGFGIANIEAFALHVPVIRSKTGGYAEMRDLCFGMEYGDVTCLKELLARFFAGDPAFKEKADLAEKEVSRFSTEKEASAYADLYMRAVRDSAGKYVGVSA